MHYFALYTTYLYYVFLKMYLLQSKTFLCFIFALRPIYSVLAGNPQLQLMRTKQIV